MVRRHEPQPATDLYGYRNYLPCLKWEFGFSCAFCLSHEADLAFQGKRTEIEHFIPVSVDDGQRNVYRNCFLICPFCNQSRGKAPNHDPRGGGGRLLNPCRVVWHEAFVLEGDEIQPRREDPSAKYTWETYDLKDQRKTKMREMRRKTVESFIVYQRRSLDVMALLHAKAKEKADPTLLDTAQEVWNMKEPVEQSMARFQPIPSNTGTSCRCGDTKHHTLPEVLERQLIEINL